MRTNFALWQTDSFNRVSNVLNFNEVNPKRSQSFAPSFGIEVNLLQHIFQDLYSHLLFPNHAACYQLQVTFDAVKPRKGQLHKSTAGTQYACEPLFAP